MDDREKQFLLINLSVDESYTFGEIYNKNILLINKRSAGIKTVLIIL